MPDRQSDLLPEVLEKMIDCQISNTTALTALKDIVDESNDRVKDVSAHFTNGFRSEIKAHISNELKKIEKNDEQIITLLEAVLKEIKNVKSWGFWAKIFAAFVVGVGGIAAAVIKIIDVAQ